MFCTNCGNELNDKATICTKCGLPVGVEKKFCAACGTEIKNERQAICLNCGVLLTNQAVRKAPTAPAIKSGLQGGVRSRTVFILLGIFLGAYGVHNFYAGYKSKAFVQLGVGIFGLITSFFLIGGVILLGLTGWAIYEIVTTTVDADGNPFA